VHFLSLLAFVVVLSCSIDLSSAGYGDYDGVNQPTHALYYHDTTNYKKDARSYDKDQTVSRGTNANQDGVELQDTRNNKTSYKNSSDIYSDDKVKDYRRYKPAYKPSYVKVKDSMNKYSDDKLKDPRRPSSYKPVTKPAYKPVAKPAYKPAPKPTYKPVAKPTYKPAQKSSYKPPTRPLYKPEYENKSDKSSYTSSSYTIKPEYKPASYIPANLPSPNSDSQKYAAPTLPYIDDNTTIYQNVNGNKNKNMEKVKSKSSGRNENGNDNGTRKTDTTVFSRKGRYYY